MKDPTIIMEKLNQIQDKINILKSNSESLRINKKSNEESVNLINPIAPKVYTAPEPQVIPPKTPITPIIKVKTIPPPPIRKTTEVKESPTKSNIKEKSSDVFIPTRKTNMKESPTPKASPKTKSPIAKTPIRKRETREIMEENPVVEKQSPTLSACIITSPSYIDIDSDGYSITSDFIQLYNGKILRCPSLTLAGSFCQLKDPSKSNIWEFMDAEMGVRGRLRRMSSFLELILEAGKWTHFTCQGKIRIIGNLQNQTIEFNKQIVAAKGKNENDEQSELVIKSYTPLTLSDINMGTIFIISFMSRQSHILEIK